MQLNKLYHGTNVIFHEFRQDKARVPNDLYGGGVGYFTDSMPVAKGYATAMYNKSKGDKVVYEVSVKIDRLFDIDHKFTGTDLQKFVNRSNSEQFARGAGLLGLGQDRISVLMDLEDGRKLLSGDQVFKGLSGGMMHTAKAREKLIQLGYDGLRYQGGLISQTHNLGLHNVYLVYKSQNIKINKRYIIPGNQISIGNDTYNVLSA